MTDRFDICHPITASWEGGWSDHKADPGGPTMYGVTQATYTAARKRWGLLNRSVKLITKDEALRIYRFEYWDKCNASQLVPGVDLAVYDASVNSGVSRGGAWLKAAAGSNDHSQTVKRICKARLGFMQSLKIWKTFGKGWGRRVADIEVRGVAMALAYMGATDSRIKQDARAEATKAKTTAVTADRAAKTTATGAAGSAGAPVIDPAAIDTTALWVLGGFALVLAIAAVLLVVRKNAAQARADAYVGAAA
jgi:lysozyme family protein